MTPRTYDHVASPLRIHFSLKWMLLAVAYFAFVAMGLVHGSGLWSSILWAIAVVAALTSILAVCFWRGQRQAVATVFALFAVAYSLAIWCFPESSLTSHLGRWLDIDIPISEERSSRLDGRMESILWELHISQSASNEEYRDRVTDQMIQVIDSTKRFMVDSSREKTINAFSVMAAGFLGAFIGAWIWKHRGRE